MGNSEVDYTYWNALTDELSEEYCRYTVLDRLIAKEQGAALPHLEPLASAETNSELEGFGPFTFATDHTDQFLHLLSILEDQAKDLLISYYLLRKTQTSLNHVVGKTQTVVGTYIASATRVLAAASVLGTNPNLETIQGILTDANLKQDHLAHITHRLLITNDAAKTAKAFRLTRAQLRKLLKHTAQQLAQSTDIRQFALGHLIERLYYRAAPSRQNKQHTKAITIQDPHTLGEHDIDIDSAGIDHLFQLTSEPR